MSSFDIRHLAQTSSFGSGIGLSDGGATTPIRSRLSPVVLVGMVRIAEVLVVIALGLILHQVYVAKTAPLSPSYGLTILFTAAGLAITFQAVGAYTITALRSFIKTGLRMAAAWSFVFLAAFAVLFFLKAGESVSRIWIATWYIGASPSSSRPGLASRSLSPG
jgi:hypothetical protein